MSTVQQQMIRNFCIIAHIDHGKSTLADRLLETTGAVAERQRREQVLDQMDLERERGITIKASAFRLDYRGADGREYVLNLIDTPGHVDFSYEVSRSLAACEGTLLVVDAAQGVEAQTLANAYLAVESGLGIIPVINKIDLPNADAQRTRAELDEIVGLRGEEALEVSAKQGVGIEALLEAIVNRLPPPAGEEQAPLQALIFDAHFDPHRGIIAYVRVRNGSIEPGQRIRMMATGKVFEVSEVGHFRLELRPAARLSAGEVGYVIAAVKQIGDARVGDTITSHDRPAAQPLPGYRRAKPMVFCGLYPSDSDDYPALRTALEKLGLNDAALVFEPESSPALGFGFRCGFLGLLHMEIVQERLEREYNLDLVATAPSVAYRVTQRGKAEIEVDSPARLPPPERIETISEPYVKTMLMAPREYVGACLELAEERRGIHEKMEFSPTHRVVITYQLPLSEILLDFFDQLKSRTRGYGSFDYEFVGYRPSDLVKLDLLINGQPVDALSLIVHRSRAEKRGRALVEGLKAEVPRQLFEVRIQAALGGRIIASDRVAPLRKDVLAKCYGGDVTRKRKLLEKQKAGKKRMKQVGRVEIPQEAFLSVLRIGKGKE
jgi:GTP-binding protein LepA